VNQHTDAEVVIVDDGSTDATPQMVAHQFPKASLIRNLEPRGIIAARNQGFAHCHGDIVFTLDDDAKFRDETAIETVLEDFFVSLRWSCKHIPCESLLRRP
jgi:glycosyltransferase involved in cell wall biosynthesis